MSDAHANWEFELNPLIFRKVDESWIYGRPEGSIPSLEEVVEYFCGQSVNPAPENLCRRYLELTRGAPTLPVVPADDVILKKLVKPLHNAIASYMLGNYYGTIALAGMVCEMLTIFLFEIHQFKITDQPFDEKRQRKVLGSTFEKLGQERRVRVLAGFGVIPEDMVSRFDVVRELRRRHLHLLSQDASKLQNDALACYRASVELVALVLRIEFDNGKIGLRPQIRRYLDSKRDQETEKAPPERG